MGMCDYSLKINTAASGAEESMATLEEGLTNISQALNEAVNQLTFLGNSGWASSEVTGAQYIITLTGKRVTGDTAQDYIFGKAFSIGSDRKTTFELTNPAGDKISGSCTIAKIGLPSGDVTGDSGDISFEIHFNGKPTFTAHS